MANCIFHGRKDVTMSRIQSKKVVLLTVTDLSAPVTEGILKKMLGQKKAWETLGFTAELIFRKGNAILNDDGQILRIMPAWGKRMQFFMFLLRYLVETKNSPDILYIRYPFSTPAFVWFLKAVKARDGNLKIILEIPTMPYDQEFTGINRWKWLVDKHYRKKLTGMTYLAVVIGNPVPFPGIKTIHISNAIDIEADFSEIQKADDAFHMIAVGLWRYWHGLDRLIAGLAAFRDQYPGKKAVLTIVGDGVESVRYRTMTEQYKLWEEVIFTGPKSEEEIMRLCQSAHLGIGVLGSHRKGLESHAPLKHRTYAAAGLPFVFSTADPDFADALFALRIPSDESPIDVAELIAFCKNLTDTPAEIHAFAAENLTWEKQMKKVLDNL